MKHWFMCWWLDICPKHLGSRACYYCWLEREDRRKKREQDQRVTKEERRSRYLKSWIGLEEK